jgi:hypothetical protein
MLSKRLLLPQLLLTLNRVYTKIAVTSPIITAYNPTRKPAKIANDE